MSCSRVARPCTARLVMGCWPRSSDGSLMELICTCCRALARRTRRRALGRAFPLDKPTVGLFLIYRQSVCIEVQKREASHGCQHLHRAPPREDLSVGAIADVLEELCDGLRLGQVDLVANDTGGAISQIFAARYPGRLRSFTLTN